MPVYRQKKDTTPNLPGSTQEQTVPPLPDQQEFRQYLRELAQSAIRTLVEGVMRSFTTRTIAPGHHRHLAG